MKAFVLRLWEVLRRPHPGWPLGAVIAAAFAGGIMFWGAFNWSLELTNTETFCLTCHEMEANVYQEYKGSIHDANRSGVRATCPDCHVPDPWIHKIRRKIQASNELLHKALGTIDTREKFEAKRLALATSVWTTMKETDSRECRNCHHFDAFDMTRQQKRARDRHTEAQEDGRTCIDCHKGIAHELPQGAFNAERELNETWNAHRKR